MEYGTLYWRKHQTSAPAEGDHAGNTGRAAAHSAAAVSKWERQETLPDISLVIPLAAYFGVSTDEILGLDAAKNEEKIKQYLDEYHHLGAMGKVHEKFDLMVQAYAEFPNDWRIMEEYMWQLNYDPNCTGPYGDAVHKEELYRLCARVLEECTLDKPRYAALSILGGLYQLDGDLNKAIETAERFPEYYMTQGEERENLFAAEDGDQVSDEWWKQIRENVFELTEMLLIKVRNMALTPGELSVEGQIKYLKKAAALIELVVEEGDYGFFHYHLSELHVWIANRYVMLEETDAAFAAYAKGLAHAKAYDDLPRVSTHTSFLLRGKVMDMTQTCSDTEKNLVARQIDDIRSFGIYPKIKDTPQLAELLARYQPFAKMKKDRK